MKRLMQNTHTRRERKREKERERERERERKTPRHPDTHLQVEVLWHARGVHVHNWVVEAHTIAKGRSLVLRTRK